MQTINIVLVEPQIPQNTGNIARTCACTGARLHLIEPMGFTPTDTKLKRAGLDYWNQLDITTYPSLDAFFSSTQGNFFYFTTKAQHTYTDVSYTDNTYLFFGREDAGLPEELLVKNPQNCVRLPMLQQSRSLNLSNAVAIGVYEVLRQQQFKGLSGTGELHRLNWDN